MPDEREGFGAAGEPRLPPGNAGCPSVSGWEGDLPPGYGLREDADLLVLLGPGGSEVAAFGAPGTDPFEVIAAAWEDYE